MAENCEVCEALAGPHAEVLAQAIAAAEWPDPSRSPLERRAIRVEGAGWVDRSLFYEHVFEHIHGRARIGRHVDGAAEDFTPDHVAAGA